MKMQTMKEKTSPRKKAEEKREYNRQCDSCDCTDRILRVGLSTV